MIQFLNLIILLPFLFLGRFSEPLKSEHHLLIPAEKKMFIGEDITYVVKYTFIKLGEVRLKVVDKVNIKGREFYSTVAYIDSYSDIPFVDLHQIYESKVNNEYYSDYFKGIIKYEKYSTFTEYFFDYAKSSLRVKKGKVKPYELWTDSTTVAEKMYHDGLSIFYYARMNTGQKKSVNVPCFVKEEKVFTKINFYPEVKPVSIDAVDYDISCVRLDGETDFVSVYGLTGFFEGWFTNDEAAVPIKARMRVIIGNVTLELKSWKREGWNPPKYRN